MVLSSANTDGSISSTVSANTTSGFSIVSYTGKGTGNSTVGHGLGVTPKIIIVKNRGSATGELVLFIILSLGNDPKNLNLNTTVQIHTSINVLGNKYIFDVD
jgi:predicted aconitase with swiveling domain